MCKKAKTNKKGFTLIELLIIIAIIGILATVILVSLNFAKDDARATKALVSLESAAKAAEICLIRGGDLNIPTTLPTDNPNVAICNLSSITEHWPNLTGTGVRYRGINAWTASSAFGIRVADDDLTKQIVCAANVNGDGWLNGTTGHPGVSYDFRGSSASCRKYGF